MAYAQLMIALSLLTTVVNYLSVVFYYLDWPAGVAQCKSILKFNWYVIMYCFYKIYKNIEHDLNSPLSTMILLMCTTLLLITYISADYCGYCYLPEYPGQPEHPEQ
jgi:hypothetical protein